MLLSSALQARPDAFGLFYLALALLPIFLMVLVSYLVVSLLYFGGGSLDCGPYPR